MEYILQPFVQLNQMLRSGIKSSSRVSLLRLFSTIDPTNPYKPLDKVTQKKMNACLLYNKNFFALQFSPRHLGPRDADAEYMLEKVEALWHKKRYLCIHMHTLAHIRRSGVLLLKI